MTQILYWQLEGPLHHGFRKVRTYRCSSPEEAVRKILAWGAELAELRPGLSWLWYPQGPGSKADPFLICLEDIFDEAQ